MRSKRLGALGVAAFWVGAAAAPPPRADAGYIVATYYAPYGAQRTTLVVTSTPSAARVTVDGRDVGFTPIFFNDLAPGNHRVTVGDVAEEVELTPGGVTHVDVHGPPSPSTSTAPETQPEPRPAAPPFTAPAERPETWMTCGLCGGTGLVTCPTCWGGGGQVRCKLCGGTGEFRGERCPMCDGRKFVKCPECHGTGRVTCPRCGGTGKYFFKTP